jgi:hypothetical protein
VKNDPGSAASSVGPAYCHERLKIRSCSRLRISGAEYHEAGSVAPARSSLRSVAGIATATGKRYTGRGSDG